MLLTIASASSANTLASFQWSVAGPFSDAALLSPLLPAINTSQPGLLLTSLTSATLVLAPNLLVPAAFYSFAASGFVQPAAANASGGQSAFSAQYTLRVAGVPGGADGSPKGGMSVSPATSPVNPGYGMTTTFVVTPISWIGDTPLNYSVSYVVVGASDTQPVALTNFVAGPQISVLLPGGLSDFGNQILLQISAMAVGTGVVSLGLAHQLVYCQWHVDGNSSFVNDLTSSATALASSNPTKANQLVSGLGLLLNGQSNTLDAAATAAAAAQREALMSVLVSTTGSGPASPTALDISANAVNTLCAVPEELSPAAASSALAVLGSLANTTVPISANSAQLITGALTGVSASVNTSAPDGGASTLGKVLGTLGSLGSSQLSQVAPGEPPQTVSTKSIQMSVLLDHPCPPPPTNCTSLLSGPLSAPGSAAAFSAPPAGALAGAGGAPVATTFISLAFDPNGGSNASAGVATGGLARLAFSSGGVKLNVSGLATPITFNLSAPASTGGGANASNTSVSCSFWNPDAGSYQTKGCVGLPNPFPAGHHVAWVPGVQTPNDTALAWAWNISWDRSSGSPNLVAGCKQGVLDCETLGPAGKLYLNPMNPFADGAVSCVNVTIPLRVFYGPACSLWQPNNSAGCSWNALKQVFEGPGCARSGASQSCMCRHLTDFVAVKKPTIAVCSISQLTSLSAADVFVKLRFLLYCVAGLFVFMLGGAIVAWGVDLATQRRLLKMLRQPDFGFQELRGPRGAEPVWTWNLYQARAASKTPPLRTPNP